MPHPLHIGLLLRPAPQVVHNILVCLDRLFHMGCLQEFHLGAIVVPVIEVSALLVKGTVSRKLCPLIRPPLLPVVRLPTARGSGRRAQQL
jgi:hypothetical protein